MRIRTARQIARNWQKRLRLLDWRICVRFGTRTEMRLGDGSDAYGLNYWHTEESLSEILLARKQSDADTEATIVHELLHLVIDAPRGDFRKYDLVTERAINTISEALLEAQRNG